MKKYLIVALLAMVVFYPLAGTFAQEKNGPVKNGIATGVPEGEHINAFRVDKIIDSGVINLEGKRIGTIDDLVIDIDTGRIVYAVLEFGGFLGFSDKLFAVPWQSLSSVPAEGIFIYFAGRDKVLKAGDTVTVTGSMISVDDTPLMIATKIKEGNKEMQVRDNEGYPIWMGWRKTK